MASQKWVEIEGVRCVAETDAALQCVIEGKRHWIPKSQIEESSEVSGEGDSGTLTVAEWIAIEKEII